MTSRDKAAPTSETYLDAAAEAEYISMSTLFTTADIVVKADFQPATSMPIGMCTDRSTAMSPMAEHMPDIGQPACINPVVHDLATAVSMSGSLTNGSTFADLSSGNKATQQCSSDHGCKTATSGSPLRGPGSKNELQLLLACPLTKVYQTCWNLQFPSTEFVGCPMASPGIAC